MGLVQVDVESAETGAELLQYMVIKFKSVTYSSFTTGSLSEFIEVDKEFLDTDAVLASEGLELRLNVGVGGKVGIWGLERARVSVSTLAHVLSIVAE